MEIGNRIRELRKEKRMTLVELSDSSKVALATLSRIENGKMTGTLESHISIAKVLGIPLKELYQDIELHNQTIDIATAKSARLDVFVHNDDASYRMLTTKAMEKKMMPVLIKVAPGATTHKEQTGYATEKFLYILDGQLEVSIADTTRQLNKGDTIYFDSSLAHVFKNAGKKEARAICVTSPPAL